MKNYLNFETEIKDLENELEKLKDPYNQEGLSEVDTQKISSTQVELDKKLNDIYFIYKLYRYKNTVNIINILYILNINVILIIYNI